MEIKYTPEFFASFKKCFSSNPRYAIPRWFRNTYYELKWAWQRVFRGFDDRWYWEYPGYILDMSIEVINRLSKNTSGYPANETDCKTLEDWQKILREIKEGFWAGKRVYNQWSKDLDKDIKKFQDMLRGKYAEHFLGLWD